MLLNVIILGKEWKQKPNLQYREYFIKAYLGLYQFDHISQVNILSYDIKHEIIFERKQMAFMCKVF
jgi:hypothetical protein